MQNEIINYAKELLGQYNGDINKAIQALYDAQLPTDKKLNIEYGPVVVSVKELSKKYKVGKQKISALNGVNLEIKQGEFVALTGSSGSGKSTLLQLIGGLDKADNGTVEVNGQNLAKLRDAKLSKFRNKTIGFVFQFFYLQPFLNLETNVEVPAMFARQKPKDRHNQSNDMIRAVDLSDRTKHLPRELSGGQMQRAAIARALMNKPKLLLADEPTGNLDSTNAHSIFDMFEKLRNEFGTTVIVVTHDQSLASRADRIVRLSDGVIV
ncbi:MAG: ABC transporter ATP-binding protein [Patescibacteria group bacterium]|jgi:ABC-type lipoprotein export system ATPase subunit|nr:ABC transporter ATP-binding protein [Patescibacteria group bacterium]